jgi:hypothetical protein
MKKRKKPARAKAAKKYFKPNESRRGFIRVDFEPGSKIGISTESGQSSYDALDISVYGLSFLASPEASARFTMGAHLPSLAFVVNGRQVTVGGKVAYLHTGLIAGLSKVAIEFTEIAVEDVWHLSRYVAEKAGVHKPGQISGGMIELEDLLAHYKHEARASKKKPKAKAKAKAKTKTKKKSRK